MSFPPVCESGTLCPHWASETSGGLSLLTVCGHTHVRIAPYLQNRGDDGGGDGACGLWPGPGPSLLRTGHLTVWWCWGPYQDLVVRSQREKIRLSVNMHATSSSPNPIHHNHDLCRHQYSGWESARMRDGCDLCDDAHVGGPPLVWPYPWRSPHPSLTGPGDRVPEMKLSVS